MTAQQALHLIEQFAAQAPFAIWITDSRGVAIFANKRLHVLLGIPEHPSGALGVNLLEDPAIEQLGLGNAVKRLMDGYAVDLIVPVPEPAKVRSNLPIGRTAAMTVRVTGFGLRSASQKIEHFVIILEDVTSTYEQREKLRAHLRDIAVFAKTKRTRSDKLEETRKEIAALEAEIRTLGKEPAP